MDDVEPLYVRIANSVPGGSIFWLFAHRHHHHQALLGGCQAADLVPSASLERQR